MAYAPLSVEVVLGEFQEKECGNYFHYSKNVEDNFSFCKDFPHIVWVGDQQQRYALVKKTVAYICVDEDEYGQPVVEKWQLKKHVQYV